jgi:CRISPR-associated protein Csc1
MIPQIYQVTVTLHEATFFASHELDELYFTEPVIGNYALSYAMGWINSPYNRYHVGYAEDFPSLNERGIYITPAWPVRKPTYRIERFNCQSESYKSGMTNNAVVEAAGRQHLIPKGSRFQNRVTGKTVISANNRPQTGVIKLLKPENQFECHVISKTPISLPHYIRLGKFMSKARIDTKPVHVKASVQFRAPYPLINPVDMETQSSIYFGDVVNIHPTPLVANAEIDCQWWVNGNDVPIVPSQLSYKGLD